jgi:hypothetical protein
MRTIKPEEFAVYQLDELEPDARRKAIEDMAERLAGEWWDQHDNADIRAVIVYTLAEQLRSPGWDKYGEGDFPGIDGIRVDAWDLDRGQSLGLTGVLNRENAPALPWADGVAQAELASASWSGTMIDVEWDEDALDPDQERDPTVVREECRDLAVRVREAIEAAISEALAPGVKESEYKGSAEYAEQHIEANGCEFLADGTLYP